MLKRILVALSGTPFTPVAVRRAVDLAKEATYVSVGVGLLTFQRAQVRRRELERALRN